jgi:predicted nuclease of predicted toxin-antitoxin system
MRFLVDRCAGTKLAQWLRERNFDVVESRERGADPGDRALLEWATREGRILITIDTDFGRILFTEDVPYCGLIRLPDVSAERRIAILADLLDRHSKDLESNAIVTVRAGRVRISYPPRRS